ncbi:MAG: hypothetical protein ACRDWD_10475 [Acidimicrobiia bacterium]
MATTATNTKPTDQRGGARSDAGDDARDVGRAALEAAGIDNDSVRRLAGESRRVLREQPALVIGGAAVTGLVLGRFWKLHLLRVLFVVLAFVAGFFADRYLRQSEEPVAT